jgi:D-alanyl-lipoteichoic acid acyltransferase DltB (MBOAT superfamily)
MSFTSVRFLLFIGIALILYYLSPKKYQWVILLAASYCFYAAGGLGTLAYLLFTTLTTYAAALILDTLSARRRALPKEDKAAISRLRGKKRLVVLCVTLMNFGLLYVMKYWNVTADALNGIFDFSLPLSELIIPVGISFYIFQSVGYVIDVYREKYAAERNPARFALFVSFFPQLVQGPISRFDQLSEQLFARRGVNFDDIKYGIQLAMWGYFKKLVIAERAGVIVGAVFGDAQAHSGSMIAVSVLFYCVQLYCDFSGGIDISRGVAKMFGVDLMENFRRPIFATSLSDFWRRWHISLGTWMRDYLFYPLSLSKPLGKLGRYTRRRVGGTLGKILPSSIATFVVYFVIGIWHGVNFRYIVFGMWNGLVITSSLLLSGVYAKARKGLRLNDEGLTLKILRIVRTSLLVFVGRYLTRAPRLLTALYMLKKTVTRFDVSRLFDGTVFTLGLPRSGVLIVALGMLVVLAVEFFQERNVHLRERLETKSALLQWLAIVVPLAAILLLGAFHEEYVAAEFIYAQF